METTIMEKKMENEMETREKIATWASDFPYVNFFLCCLPSFVETCSSTEFPIALALLAIQYQ